MRHGSLLPLLMLTAAAPAEERRYMLGSFERLRVQGPYAVEVVPGSPGATASGPAEEIAKLRVRIEGETLIVNSGTSGWERRTRTSEPVAQIRITTPRLRAINANGGARITVTAMRAPRIDLGLEGTGSLDVRGVQADELFATHTGFGVLTLAGRAGKVRVRGHGGAAVEAPGFTADDAVLVWESLAPLRIGVRYTAQVIAMGQGPVTVLGKPECRVQGTGPVTCEGKVRR